MAKIKRNCRSCSWIWIHVQSFAAYAAKSLRNVVKFHAVDALNRCQKLIFPQYKFNHVIFKWSCKCCIKLVHFRKIPFKIFINFLFYEWVIFLYVNFQFFFWLQVTCIPVVLIQTLGNCICIFLSISSSTQVNIYGKFAQLSSISF